MTEISPAAVPLEPSLAATAVQPADAHIANGTPSDEDPTQIRCICGFEDDDGKTVLCEDCQTWQHIACYYPGKSITDVPEIHNCVHCNPRNLDGKAAAERQRLSRTAVASEKKRKPPTKPTTIPIKAIKKGAKIKESGVNGVSHSEVGYPHDRASGSPHDPPPAKKAKTSHRQSASVTNITLPPSTGRKRTNSVAVAHLSPTKSPSSPMVNGQFDQDLSSEFMDLYNNEYTPISTNSYQNLSFLTTLSTWLDDPNELGKVTNGKTHNDVFKTWSKPWSDLLDASPGLTKTRQEDPSILAHGKHPIHEYLVVNSYTPSGAFIGELNGQVGKIDDYCDESIRWNTLKHPEPFVFFHDKLPICIDARKEGSQLRFLRRSCKPNLSIQIIIVDREYRFCFVSSQEIHENEEVTIGWNLTDTGHRCAQKLLQGKPFTADEASNIISWVSGIFSNFGTCACEDRATCTLENLRLRASHYLSSKPAARKKVKRGGGVDKVSPYGTGRATNSRAGSEAVNQMDLDEEAIGSPSATGSGHSKPPSRDITPAQPNEQSIGLGLGLSAREQKKLQQQERLFEKMENDGTKGKKRNSSGGTVLNTPPVTASKQLGHPDSSNPSPTSTTNLKPRINGRIDKKSRRSVPNGVGNSGTPSRPTYSESATQTEESSPPKLTEEELQLVKRRKLHGCSFAMKLLRQTRRQKQRSNSVVTNGYSTSPSPALSSPNVDFKLDLLSKQMPPPPLPPYVPKTEPRGDTSASVSPIETKEVQDVEMKDVEPTPEPVDVKTPSPNIDQANFSSAKASPQLQSAELPREASPPLKQSSISQSVENTSQKPSLSVGLPLPPTKISLPSPSSTPSTPGAFGVITPGSVPPPPPVTPGVAGGSPTMVQSPTAFQSTQSAITSPVLTNAPVPTPIKKKLTLSDYTSRKKKQEAQKDVVLPSPLGTSTPISSMPLESGKSEDLEKEKDSGNADSANESPVLAFSEKGEKPTEELNGDAVDSTPMDVDVKTENGISDEVQPS